MTTTTELLMTGIATDPPTTQATVTSELQTTTSQPTTPPASIPGSLDFGFEPLEVCLYGGDTGLTNTSILVHYRGVVITPGETTVQEWTPLIAIPTNESFREMIPFELSGTADGVQFRFLQLEHGGGQCSCWRVTVNTITLNGISAPVSSVCFVTTDPATPSTACAGSASVERGGMTTVMYLPGRSGGEQCPANSSQGLIAPQISPLLQDCASTTPRM